MSLFVWYEDMQWPLDTTRCGGDVDESYNWLSLYTHTYMKADTIEDGCTQRIHLQFGEEDRLLRLDVSFGWRSENNRRKVLFIAMRSSSTGDLSILANDVAVM